jgi:peptidoglycan/xylan/chitin deacetylase (PgdA/CDA1 family)
MLDKVNNKSAFSNLSFDLIANIYYHLARIEELNINHPDAIDEQVKDSILYKYEQFKLPVVDILLKWFDGLLQKSLLAANPFILKKCAYPNGEQFGVAITHDVDIIRAYHPLKKVILSTLYHLKLKKSPTPQQMENADRENWGFEAILDFYKTFKGKGTFFFIARYLENQHFRYRLRDRKIKDIIKRLTKDGHEIAFHASRYAFEHPKRYKSELNRLKKVCSCEISGLRHHYLRCLYPDIWLKAEKLGLLYDASLIYRKHSGFRAATTHPFITFEHHLGRELNLWEFSTSFFEGTLKGEEEIKALIKTVAKNNGLLNIIWHTNSFYDSNEFQVLWKIIISELKQYNTYNETLTNHLYWQSHKKSFQISSIKGEKRAWKFNFTGVDDDKKYSLQLIGNSDDISIKAADNLTIIKSANGFIIKGINDKKCKLEVSTV